MMSFLMWQLLITGFLFCCWRKGMGFLQNNVFTKLSKRGCNFSLFYSFFDKSMCLNNSFRYARALTLHFGEKG